MSLIEVSGTVRTTRACTIKLDKALILNMLRQELKAQGFAGSILPTSADVEFHVPGGADWSNCSIDIDEENPVYVTWVEEESTDL